MILALVNEIREVGIEERTWKLMICKHEDGKDSVCFCHSSSVVISIRLDILMLFSVCSGVDVYGGVVSRQLCLDGEMLLSSIRVF